jgi:hypothetical protein
MSSKKLTCKGPSRWVFIRVYKQEIQSVMLVFSTQLCELLSPNLLSGSTLPPPFPVSKYSIYRYRQCVTGRGVGVLSPVGDNIPQEFNTLYLARFRTYKIARPPQTKILEGRGAQTDKHQPQSPVTGKFF